MLSYAKLIYVKQGRFHFERNGSQPEVVRVGSVCSIQHKHEDAGPGEMAPARGQGPQSSVALDRPGVTYKADPRHAEIMIRELGLEPCRPVTTPGAREDVAKPSSVVVSSSWGLTNAGDGEPLASPEATRFRALTAPANYLAQDRADIHFAVKELARRMATPRSGDMEHMKQLGDYLVGTHRAVYMYPWQSEPTQRDAFVDSRSWRSTSGGALTWRKHVIKT